MSTDALMKLVSFMAAILLAVVIFLSSTTISNSSTLVEMKSKQDIYIRRVEKNEVDIDDLKEAKILIEGINSQIEVLKVNSKWLEEIARAAKEDKN